MPSGSTRAPAATRRSRRTYWKLDQAPRPRSNRRYTCHSVSIWASWRRASAQSAKRGSRPRRRARSSPWVKRLLSPVFGARDVESGLAQCVLERAERLPEQRFRGCAAPARREILPRWRSPELVAERTQLLEELIPGCVTPGGKACESLGCVPAPEAPDDRLRVNARFGIVREIPHRRRPPQPLRAFPEGRKDLLVRVPPAEGRTKARQRSGIDLLERVLVAEFPVIRYDLPGRIEQIMRAASSRARREASRLPTRHRQVAPRSSRVESVRPIRRGHPEEPGRARGGYIQEVRQLERQPRPGRSPCARTGSRALARRVAARAAWTYARHAHAARRASDVVWNSSRRAGSTQKRGSAPNGSPASSPPPAPGSATRDRGASRPRPARRARCGRSAQRGRRALRLGDERRLRASARPDGDCRPGPGGAQRRASGGFSRCDLGRKDAASSGIDALCGATSPRSTKPGSGADRAPEECRSGARRADHEDEPFVKRAEPVSQRRAHRDAPAAGPCGGAERRSRGCPAPPYGLRAPALRRLRGVARAARCAPEARPFPAVARVPRRSGGRTGHQCPRGAPGLPREPAWLRDRCGW